MLLLGSCCIVFYAISTITSGVLQSIDRGKKTVINSLISLLIHIGLVIVLLQKTKLGVYVLVIGNVIFLLVVCILNQKELKKLLNYKQEYK